MPTMGVSPTSNDLSTKGEGKRDHIAADLQRIFSITRPVPYVRNSTTYCSAVNSDTSGNSVYAVENIAKLLQ